MRGDETVELREPRGQAVRADHRGGMDQKGVVLGRRPTAHVGADEIGEERREEEASGDETARGLERRIGAVEIAQMDLALVPAAGARERRDAVEDRDRAAAPSQREGEAGAHDAGAEDRDPLRHRDSRPDRRACRKRP